MPNEKNNFLKAKIKACALSSFKTYNEKSTVSAVSNFYKNEISALKTISKNNDLIMWNLHIWNSIVLIDKCDYLDKMCNFLSDSKEIVKYFAADEEHLIFIIRIEKKLTNSKN